MITANVGLLLIGGFLVFEIGVYFGGEIERNRKKDDKNEKD